MENPFSKYLPKAYSPLEEKFFDGEDLRNREYMSIEEIFQPKINYSSGEDLQIIANIGNSKIPLYTTHDLLSWDFDKDTQNHFKGLIGERILAIILHAFLAEVASGNPDSKYEIMREKGGHRAKRMIANFSDRYIMKFNNTTSLWVLQKSTYDIHPVERAMQDKFGLKAICELDGLGFFICDDKRYVLVGESSAKESEDKLMINSWEKSKKRNSTLGHVFNPLRNLYSDSDFVYVILAYDNQLFDRQVDPPRIKREPARISTALRRQGIDTILFPFPEGNHTLKELAIKAEKHHGVLRQITKRAYIK